MPGLYVSGHSLDGFEESLAAQTDTALTAVVGREVADNTEITIGDIVSSIDRRVNKNGQPWAIIGIEDYNGARVEIMAFARTYTMTATSIAEDAIMLICTYVQYHNDRMSVICDNLKPPDLDRSGSTSAPPCLTTCTNQYTPKMIAKLKSVLLGSPGDSDVRLELVDGNSHATLVLGEHLWVDRDASLISDPKVTVRASILGWLVMVLIVATGCMTE